MTIKPLVLGGTIEARTLCEQLHARGLDAEVSLAGRVSRPLRHAVRQRAGGFGGVPGLIRYLRDHAISHVIDGTHPFAAQISRNAIDACAAAGVPLLALTRPAWRPQAGDQWTQVADIAGAVRALDRPASRVLLAIGRQNLPAFSAHPQHFYLLRLVDPPDVAPPLPHHHVIVSRGPFTEAADRALIEAHDIDLVVSKNAGGSGAYAKIAAARALGLPVLMIDRPSLPPRRETHKIDDVLSWLDHAPSAPSAPAPSAPGA